MALTRKRHTGKRGIQGSIYAVREKRVIVKTMKQKRVKRGLGPAREAIRKSMGR